MEYISSDTSVWIDFSAIHRTRLPFFLPYTYIMHKDAVTDEILSPPNLGNELISYGLKAVEITYEEFELAESYGQRYIRLSRYDRIALAIAKSRSIILLTGDKALRNAAQAEGVRIMGTLGILDRLLQGSYIDRTEYRSCLRDLLTLNGSSVRLPKSELESRLLQYSEDAE